jgi:L-malate glycosyltransferase
MTGTSTRAAPGVAESLRVTIAGPVLTHSLAEFLDDDADRLPPGIGGASSVVSQLVADLLSRGQRVSVVTLDQSVSTSTTATGPLLDLVYGPYRPRHRMRRDLMRVERNAVRDGVLQTRPDLVHAHWCCEYSLGAFAADIPTLVTVHDWMPAIIRLTRARWWPYGFGLILLYFSTLSRARHLTANSPYTARKVGRFTRASLEIVPNGVPDSDYLLSADDISHESRPSGPPIILSVNTGFTPRKNVGRLLEAHRELRRLNFGSQLVLVGRDYEPGGPCEAWAQQKRLAEGVTFLGPRPRSEVLSRMREATMLVHPSREESFGMTLIEAMSQRLPVIAGANSGAVPWVLADGKAGLLVDVDSPRALAEAMEALIRQEALRKQLTNEAHAWAWRSFRQSRVTDLYLEAYRRVLEEELRR